MIKVQSAAESSQRTRNILGKAVCVHGFRRLLGLGANRYAKLVKSASQGIPPPVDGRKRPRREDGSNPASVAKRGLIVDFLEDLLHTLAEPMPETSQKRKATANSVPKSMRFKRSRGKRPNKVFRKAAFNAKKLDDDGQQPMKLLPPGSFTDYLRMLQAKHPDQRFTLKLFCTVLWLALASFDTPFQQVNYYALSEDSLYSTFKKIIDLEIIFMYHIETDIMLRFGAFTSASDWQSESSHDIPPVQSVFDIAQSWSDWEMIRLDVRASWNNTWFTSKGNMLIGLHIGRQDLWAVFMLCLAEKKAFVWWQTEWTIRSTDFPERSWHPRRSSAGGYDQPLTSVLLLLMAITFWLLPHFLMWGRMPPLSSTSLRTVFTWSQRKRTSVQRRSSYNLTTPVEK